MALISVTKQNSLKIFDSHLYSSLKNHPSALFGGGKKTTQKYQGKGNMKRQVFPSDSKNTVKSRSHIFLTAKLVLRPKEDIHELKKTFKKISFQRHVQTYGLLNSPWTYLGSTTKLVRA